MKEKWRQIADQEEGRQPLSRLQSLLMEIPSVLLEGVRSNAQRILVVPTVVRCLLPQPIHYERAEWMIAKNLLGILQRGKASRVSDGWSAIGPSCAALCCTGVLIDGRNRGKACEIAGVEPRFEKFTGDDPRAFILAANVRRRHMTASRPWRMR